jgi:two-component system nitrate/nitrite response regulator NarL
MPVSVLLVDDDATFRRLAARMLTAMDLAVVGEAATVAEAIRAAAELQPDAALVDVGLPDGDGVALARTLTALPWSPRVVLTSSDREAVSPETARDAGAAAFVPKEDMPHDGLRRLLAGPPDLEYG